LEGLTARLVGGVNGYRVRIAVLATRHLDLVPSRAGLQQHGLVDALVQAWRCHRARRVAVSLLPREKRLPYFGHRGLWLRGRLRRFDADSLAGSRFLDDELHALGCPHHDRADVGPRTVEPAAEKRVLV